jgi:hypothetical protein
MAVHGHHSWNAMNFLVRMVCQPSGSIRIDRSDFIVPTVLDVSILVYMIM